MAAIPLASTADLRHRRPPYSKKRVALAIVTGLGLAMIAVLLTYVSLAYRFWSNVPHVSRDYLADLNKPLEAIPIEDQAWPKYRAAIATLDSAYKTWHVNGASPDPGVWLPLEYLRRHQEPLAAVRAAASMPSLCYVLGPPQNGNPPVNAGTQTAQDSPPEILMVLLEGPQELASLSDLLALDTGLAMREHDAQRAADNIVAMICMAQHASEPRFLVSDLVQLRIFDQTMKTTRRLLRDAPDLLNDEQLQCIQRRFENAAIKLHFAGERAMFFDLVQRIYTDNGKGDGVLFPPALATEPPTIWERALMPVKLMDAASRMEAVQWFEQSLAIEMKESALPIWQRNPQLTAKRIESLNMNEGLSIFRLWWPSFHVSYVESQRFIQQRDAMVATIALLRFQRATGQWPQALDQLQPEYLDALPIDRINGAPLCYLRRDGQPHLYSVGLDEDDDRAQPSSVPIKRWNWDRWLRHQGNGEPAPDGDWIHWPDHPILDEVDIPAAQ